MVLLTSPAMQTKSTTSTFVHGHPAWCRVARSLLFLVLGFALFAGGTAENEGTEVNDSSSATSSGPTMTPETTGASKADEDSCPSKCGMNGLCAESKKTDSIYRYGGTAMAYKPGVAISNTVCNADEAAKYRYKAASWPFTRRSARKGSAPRLDVKLRLWSCASSGGGDCCCESLGVEDASSSAATVEIWQTRPDGTYSSLKQKNNNNIRRGGNNKDECRSVVPIPSNGVTTFSTVAPGSTGMFSGLGPSGWDQWPYGPPSIHMLASVPGHEPLLVDIPALIHPKTLEQRDFSLSDWRGVSWVRGLPNTDVSSSIEISSWQPNVSENQISIEVSLYLQRHPEGQSYHEDVDLCASWMYGLPSSFFLEPIAVCAPSLMDFFDV